ncbi:NADH:ubiquinone oxidoreductase [Naganishia albida]|nr:NADH:ubiquinone oxidoreductase [Naganishia albida]
MAITPDNLQRVLGRSEGHDRLAGEIREALAVIDGVLDDYGEEHVAMSFNGGKDCTVLIHLLATCLYRRHRHRSAGPLYAPIIALYITAPSPFPELESFVQTSAAYYHLDLIRYGGGMKRALAEFQACPKGRGVRAFLVGTRRGDPHGSRLSVRTLTDKDWPQFMRVHPILDWRYTDVWAFLRECEVPYCSLYDQGYTSLGSTHNTHPNPYLLRPRETENEEPSYEPAYMLTDESKERAGRDDVPPPIVTEESSASSKVDTGKQDRTES